MAPLSEQTLMFSPSSIGLQLLDGFSWRSMSIIGQRPTVRPKLGSDRTCSIACSGARIRDFFGKLGRMSPREDEGGEIARKVADSGVSVVLFADLKSWVA